MKWFLERIMQRGVCFGGGGGGGGAQRIITDDMKAAAEVSTKQWNDYQNRFVPFENKYIASATNRDETGKLQGMVAADMAQKAGAVKVNPVQSGMQFVPAGRALAAGLTDARAGALDRKAQGMQTVVSMGRGQQTEALNGLTDQAVNSGMRANQQAISDRQAAMTDRGTTMGMVGTGLGAAGAVAMNYGGMSPAGQMNQFNPGMANSGSTLTQGDILNGASSGMGGYAIGKGGGITWNK